MAQTKTKNTKKSSNSQTKKKQESKEKYIEEIGRRKRAVARVRIYPESSESDIKVNGKNYKEYFSEFELQKVIVAPLKKAGFSANPKITILIKGGGRRGQVEAAQLGIARCLVSMDENLRKILKSSGYLSRDARVKERKKAGLKKARRAPQWRKR